MEHNKSGYFYVVRVYAVGVTHDDPFYRTRPITPSYLHRGRMILDKLIIPQLVKKLSVFYGNRRFIIASIKACLFSVS
jgi:hypothetical protein